MQQLTVLIGERLHTPAEWFTAIPLSGLCAKSLWSNQLKPGIASIVGNRTIHCNFPIWRISGWAVTYGWKVEEKHTSQLYALTEVCWEYSCLSHSIISVLQGLFLLTVYIFQANNTYPCLVMKHEKFCDNNLTKTVVIVEGEADAYQTLRHIVNGNFCGKCTCLWVNNYKVHVQIAIQWVCIFASPTSVNYKCQ